jgi:CDP-diacylglycerol--glycerol-3-phosphate 3-phosphatidyltransferase
MNIPNTITIFRLLLVPVLVLLLLSDWRPGNSTAFVIFAIAALSDMADGVLARQKKWVTLLGQLLDPIADKVLIAAALICLVDLGAVAPWIVIVILAREFAVTGFRSLAAARGIIIPSSPLGKIKIWSEYIVIGALILGEPILNQAYATVRIGLWIMLAFVLISGVHYYIKYGGAVFGSLIRPSEEAGSMPG